MKAMERVLFCKCTFSITLYIDTHHLHARYIKDTIYIDIDATYEYITFTP